MADFEIRFARPTDVDELVRLCADHAAYEKTAYDPVGKRERLAETLFGRPVKEMIGGAIGWTDEGFQLVTVGLEEPVNQ